MKYSEVIKQVEQSPLTPLNIVREFEAWNDIGTSYKVITQKGELKLSVIGPGGTIAEKNNQTLPVLQLNWEETTPAAHWTDALMASLSGYKVACMVNGCTYWFEHGTELISGYFEDGTIISSEMLKSGKWYITEDPLEID